MTEPTVAKTETVALKPCPFCGSQKVWLTDWANPAIQCRNCHLVVDTESLMDEEELVERWNRRVEE